MKMKKIISLFVALILCLSVVPAFAEEPDGGPLIMPAPDKGVTVEFKGEALEFDVAPIIENDRTLVPLRGIFEAMGCVVGYYADENNKQIITAHRGDDTLMLTIGEKAMYFNGEEITLDVPAKIKDSRTLVPIRAISEAFESEVLWDGETKTVSINPPASFYDITPKRLSETIKADDGTALIEVAAYYPFMDNSMKIPYVDEINEEYKWLAEQFVKKASDEKESALMMLEEMGKDKFVPFEFSLTYEESYNIYGILSLTTYEYVNLGGAHPETKVESRNYNPGAGMELSISDILDEEVLGMGLAEYIYGLFAKELEELEMVPDEEGIYISLEEEMGDVQCRLAKDGAVLYFNQGQVAPYALGIISVHIPYDEKMFFVDMSSNLLEEYTYQYENDKGYEWVLVSYSEDKLSVSEEYEEYPPESLLSEYYPVGMKTFSAKGIKAGNAEMVMAYVEKGKNVEEASKIVRAVLYIEDDNRITAITELEE